MLQSIHDKLKGWVAGLILGAVGLVFVFWGINWTLAPPTYAAKVNGTEISSNDVRQRYQQQLAQFERQMGGIPLTDSMRNEVKKRVLEDAVTNEALLTRTDDLGYRVSDSELLAAMSQVPAFQVDGKFDMDHAVAMVRMQGRSMNDIEALFRRDIKLRQLDLALASSSFATATEVKEFRALTHQQREVAWVTLSAAKFAADANPDDAAVKSYYESHKSEYMTPETVDLKYVEVSLAQLAAKVAVDDAQLKAYYDEQKAKTPERFSQNEQRRVRHILLAVNDPKEDAAVKTKAEGVLKRAQGGEDFSKLAKEFSQDPGSAAQGGDLGWSESKVFVGPFADAAFSMKEGEIRGPVKTQFGYHILKLDGIQAPSVKTFEQSKAELEPEFKRNEAEKLFNNAQDQLADAALQNTTDIDVVARKAGLTVQDIPSYSRSSGGGALGDVRAVTEAAFSQDVLDGRLSSTVEIEKGRGVVLHATDHKLPQQKPLAAVRGDVVAAWKHQRGIELANQAAADAVKKLTAGDSWDVVTKGLGGTLQAAKFVARADQQVPLEIRQAAFKAPKPLPKPVYANVEMAQGDVAVLALTAVRENPSDANLKEADLRQQYAARMASDEAQAYTAAVRAGAKVTLNPQAID
jgi:peptidyl-prolyl cis-trans isomerase D